MTVDFVGPRMPPNPRLFSFAGGVTGPWKSVRSRTLLGESLPAIKRLSIVSGTTVHVVNDAQWVLRGVTSNSRYTTRSEKQELQSKQAPLDRAEADCGVLIPIRKTSTWWDLTQDERRHIFEAQSHHTSVGLEYLPAIARRLHHCRDLSLEEPFDFLTWFEFDRSHTKAFEQLLIRLRNSPEWAYVDREVELWFDRESRVEMS